MCFLTVLWVGLLAYGDGAFRSHCCAVPSKIYMRDASRTSLLRGSWDGNGRNALKGGKRAEDGALVSGRPAPKPNVKAPRCVCEIAQTDSFFPRSQG